MPRREGRVGVMKVLFALAALASLVTTAHAIYEDQVGSFDWHKEHLGRVTHATFVGSGATKRAFVASEQGAVSALDFKTGDIGKSICDRFCHGTNRRGHRPSPHA
jgi:hypothetical protein